MSLLSDIRNYKPINEQEERDKAVMLDFMTNTPDCLNRSNQVAHFTTSIWTVNKERTKSLMVYHNIYNSWSWIGGHADGIENLCEVALKELKEETGIKYPHLVSDKVLSLETLTCGGYMARGIWVPGHLHFNLTYLAEADESEELIPREDENSAVHWWTFEDALKVSNESWMIENIYKKLIERSR